MVGRVGDGDVERDDIDAGAERRLLATGRWSGPPARAPAQAVLAVAAGIGGEVACGEGAVGCGGAVC